MVLFPNAKINIGLHILSKRDDGYHNISSVFAPISLCDALEIRRSSTFSFDCHNALISGENLCVKAFRLFKERFNTGNAAIQLIKRIPMGAGLGGGSSNAAFTLMGLASVFGIQDNAALIEIAEELGSDVPFFLTNEISICSSRGEIINPIPSVLSGLHVFLMHPPVHMATAEAYSNVKPSDKPIEIERLNYKELLMTDLTNDFQKVFLSVYPNYQSYLDILSAHNAQFSSLTGSGSSFYGLFHTDDHFGALSAVCEENQINYSIAHIL